MASLRLGECAASDQVNVKQLHLMTSLLPSGVIDIKSGILLQLLLPLLAVVELDVLFISRYQILNLTRHFLLRTSNISQLTHWPTNWSLLSCCRTLQPAVSS